MRRFKPRLDRARIRRLRRMPLVSPRLWLRRTVFWTGALAVSLAAITFAWAADQASSMFGSVIAWSPYAALVVSPAGFMLALLLTRKYFAGSQGSGVPQVMAALHLSDADKISRVLSLRILIGKVFLTLIGLLCGASIGREGPTVQVSASIMQGFGAYLRLPRIELHRALVLAGGAAGISAAFNTPLAGIVFAIEELSHSFESRTSGTVLGAVIVSGICTLALVGNYSYFGTSDVALDLGAGWIAVLVCGIGGGLLGGGFSSALLFAADGFAGRAGAWIGRRPVQFAGLCGLCIAILGLVSGGATYGTGYEQARGMISGDAQFPWYFFLLKWLATFASYISGIPGGIFAPSLTVGASFGHTVWGFIPSAPVGAVVLLGMVAYFSGVVQAPITAAIIVMEMTENQQMTIPLLGASMLAYAASRLVCRRSLYGALAQRFMRTL